MVKEVEDKSRSKRNVFLSYRLSLKRTFSLSLSLFLSPRAQPGTRFVERLRREKEPVAFHRSIGIVCSARRKIRVDYRRKKQRVYRDGENFKTSLNDQPDFDSKKL